MFCVQFQGVGWGFIIYHLEFELKHFSLIFAMHYKYFGILINLQAEKHNFGSHC